LLGLAASGAIGGEGTRKPSAKRRSKKVLHRNAR